MSLQVHMPPSVPRRTPTGTLSEIDAFKHQNTVISETRDALWPVAQSLAAQDNVDGVDFARERGRVAVTRFDGTCGKRPISAYLQYEPGSGEIQAVSVRDPICGVIQEFVQGDGRHYHVNYLHVAVIDTKNGDTCPTETRQLEAVKRLMSDHKVPIEFTTTRGGGQPLNAAGQVVEQMRTGKVFSNFNGRDFKIRNEADLNALRDYTWQIVPFRG